MVMLRIKDLEVFSSRKQIQKAEIRCSISGDEVLFLILSYFTSGLDFLVSKTLKNIFDHGVYNIIILRLTTYSQSAVIFTNKVIKPAFSSLFNPILHFSSKYLHVQSYHFQYFIFTLTLIISFFEHFGVDIEKYNPILNFIFDSNTLR